MLNLNRYHNHMIRLTWCTRDATGTRYKVKNITCVVNMSVVSLTVLPHSRLPGI